MSSFFKKTQGFLGKFVIPLREKHHLLPTHLLVVKPFYIFITQVSACYIDLARNCPIFKDILLIYPVKSQILINLKFFVLDLRPVIKHF